MTAERLSLGSTMLFGGAASVSSYGNLTTIAKMNNFQAARRSHKAWLGGAEGHHISLTDVYCLAADIDGTERKAFMCMSNVWSLLAIARQVNSGWDH